MDYLLAFLVGGSLCALGQTLYDRTRLTMGHVMVIFVVAGALLTAFGLYEPLIRVGGAGCDHSRLQLRLCLDARSDHPVGADRSLWSAQRHLRPRGRGRRRRRHPGIPDGTALSSKGVICQRSGGIRFLPGRHTTLGLKL